MALDIQTKLVGTKHPLTQTTYHNMIVILESEGKHEEAKELYETSLGLTLG